MQKLRSFFGNKLVLAIASIVLGIILIVLKGGAIDAFVKIIGIVLLVVAAVYCALFIISGSQRSAVQLVGAIVALIFGLLFLVRPDIIVNLFPFIMGIALAVSGAVNLVQSIMSKARGSARIASIITAIIVLLLGVVIFMNARKVVDIYVIIIGIALLINGVAEIVGATLKDPDIIDMPE